MIVVGGTYSEICFEPIWEQIFGSGFRAVNVILENDDTKNIMFYTCADNVETKAHLEYYSKLNSRLETQILTIPKSPDFRYDHPLKTPVIYPRPDILAQDYVKFDVEGEDILLYGMIEAQPRIRGQRVVYDPQSPVNPLSFSSTGSTASQLVIVVNRDEAEKITQLTDLIEIRKHFFINDHCFALIIKMGAQGAILFSDVDDGGTHIPVYQTDKVWNIGSGDVFSSVFALNWFNGKTLKDSAFIASKATAIYCNSKNLSFESVLANFSFRELSITKRPTGQIYLAGPFFTFAQRWLINEMRNSLLSTGLNVFSPFHDVGHGKAIDVVDKDLKGLDDSEIVLAVIDGLDSGTLFEVGYAIAQGKKVIAFTQNENEESLKMLEGTACIIESDLTTAIYKSYWTLEH